MLDAIQEFSIYSVPWWVWCAPIAGAAIKVGLVAVQTMGWRNALISAGAFLASAALFLTRLQARQTGWKDHEEKDRVDAQNLVNRVNSVRNHARSTRPNLERLHDDDGFKRTGD